MSLHPSLKIDRAGATQRSVLSRIERIKELIKKGEWKEDSHVLGLPKTKIVRVKAKKKAKTEEAAATGAEAPAAGGAKTAGAKPAQGAAAKK